MERELGVVCRLLCADTSTYRPGDYAASLPGRRRMICHAVANPRFPLNSYVGTTCTGFPKLMNSSCFQDRSFTPDSDDLGYRFNCAMMHNCLCTTYGYLVRFLYTRDPKKCFFL